MLCFVWLFLTKTSRFRLELEKKTLFEITLCTFLFFFLINQRPKTERNRPFWHKLWERGCSLENEPFLFLSFSIFWEPCLSLRIEYSTFQILCLSYISSLSSLYRISFAWFFGWGLVGVLMLFMKLWITQNNAVMKKLLVVYQ